MPRDNRRNAPGERINRTYESQDECKGTEYIHSDSASPQETPGTLRPASLGGAGLGTTGPARRCFILGSAFRLNDLGDESSFWTRAAFHEGLGLIYKSVRQGVGANVADRKRLPFALQHKINTAGEVTNTSGCDGTADAHALASCGSAQGLKFRDGVVVSFALSVTQPCQETERSYNYKNSHAELCLFLHSGTPTAPGIRRCV